MNNQLTATDDMTNVPRMRIRYRVHTAILAVLLLVLASPPTYATNGDMYRVTLAPPSIQAWDTEDSSEDEIICMYMLQQIRVGSTGIPQVIAMRIGVSGVHNLQRSQITDCIDAASLARGTDRLTLDIRRGDQIRVAVALVDVDDDGKEREILDRVQQAADVMERASTFAFPPATPVLSVVNLGLSIAGVVWEFFDWLNDDDDLGEASYVLDFPTTEGNSLNIGWPSAQVDWNYQIRTDVKVSPEMQVLAGDFNGDGRTDIAKISPSQRSNTSFSPTPAFIDVATAGARGSNFEISRWGVWDFLRFDTNFGVGDVNGDGRADVVAFTSYQTGGVWVALSQGTYFTITKWANAYPFYMNPLAHVAVGDFNGDRYSDILIVENGPGNTRNMWLGISDPINRRFTINQAGAVPINRHTRMLAGDFNGDQKTDVVVFGNSPTGVRWEPGYDPITGTVYLFLDTFEPIGPGEVRVAISDGTNFTVSTWDYWWMTPDINVLAYDFNADRRTDIVTFQNGDWGGHVYLGYSQAAQGSSQGSFYTAPITQWPEWRDAAGSNHPAMNPFTHVLAGRFDGGPFGSLVRFEPGTPGDVRVTKWPYAGAIGAVRPWEADERWAQWWSSTDVPVLAGDFDGDGRTDIAKCTLFDGPERGWIWVGYSAQSYSPPGYYFASYAVGRWVMR